jgi:hypothetical protein
VLDAANLQKAEDAAAALGQKLGVPVYIGIAASSDDPGSTAFFDDLSEAFPNSFVIAVGVHGTQIGGWITEPSSVWDKWDGGAPWNTSSFSKEEAPGGDVQAEVMRAINAVQPTPNPVDLGAEAVQSVRDSIASFFSDPNNQRDSLLGFLAALVALVVFALDRRRRRRDIGYGEDDSVMLPAPPAEMTPALAALVATPLNTTRAVTTALLDLAAHGRIAFYQDSTPLGPSGAIRVLSGDGTNGHAGTAHVAAVDRPLGPGETHLLEGLRSATGNGMGVGGADFAELRPLFERTGEQLERIARQQGWLQLQAQSVSRVWLGVGAALLVATVGAAVLLQPVAVVALAVAGLRILPRARHMPLPLRTRSGQMTASMVDAYRRTVKMALAGEPGTVPPWLANAEEAALWGYDWGLEGDVQALVGRNVSGAMNGPDVGGMATAGAGAGLFALAFSRSGGFGALGGFRGFGGARPIGLDTGAIANTLGGLGVSIGAQKGAATEKARDEGGAG